MDTELRFRVWGESMDWWTELGGPHQRGWYLVWATPTMGSRRHELVRKYKRLLRCRLLWSSNERQKTTCELINGILKRWWGKHGSRLDGGICSTILMIWVFGNVPKGCCALVPVHLSLDYSNYLRIHLWFRDPMKPFSLVSWKALTVYKRRTSGIMPSRADMDISNSIYTPRRRDPITPDRRWLDASSQGNKYPL